ncbi:MAG: type I-E CRISPR-associated protein Cse2/CasB [Pseudomonadota bacterium]|nr:type I-E CRISPR-associated protein Cse2/CasB [Pseudomonadota bacterium]
MADPEINSADGWWNVIPKLCAALDGKGVAPGDLARLRRLDPDASADFAFWRVMARYAPNELARAGEGAERRWMVVLSALATLQGLHDGSKRLGTALGEAGFSELRLSRLMRAEDDALAPEVRAAARYLASKGKSANLVDLAQLVLAPEGPQAEQVRRRIASAYFSATSTLSNE